MADYNIKTVEIHTKAQFTGYMFAAYTKYVKSKDFLTLIITKLADHM